MSSSSPPEKKRKSNDGAPSITASSWRDKSIAKFNLQPVPDSWKDSVGVGSEAAWQRYYNYRMKQEATDFRNESFSSDYDSDGEEIDDGCGNWQREAMNDIQLYWTDEDFDGMGRLQKLMANDSCKWQWTPSRPKIDWEDENQPRSVDYVAHVWSPWAIPHAIKMTHDWNGNVGYYGSELNTEWCYRIMDFEKNDIETSSKGWKVLCSFHSSNNNDVIKTSNLTLATCKALRKFLFGSNSTECKKLTCSDRDFLFLLFGSAGSYDKDLMEDAKDCSLGYSWCPWKDEKIKQQLIDEKAPANDEMDGKPPTETESYNPRWCSWLRYRILEVTNTLGPVSKHYKGP